MTKIESLAHRMIATCQSAKLTAKMMRDYSIEELTHAVELASCDKDFERRVINSNILNHSKWMVEKGLLPEGTKLALASTKKTAPTWISTGAAKFTLIRKESEATKQESSVDKALKILTRGAENGDTDAAKLLKALASIDLSDF